jgi:prolyl 4-hydroxylase
MMKRQTREFYEIGQQVNDEPLVCVFENFLSEQEIEQLLLAAQPKLTPALVSSAENGVVSAGRTGSTCWVPLNYNTVISELSLRIAEVVGIPLENAESFQVVHYGPAQEYAPHYDAWVAETEAGRRCMEKGGQRLVTCLLYLNNVEAGGGTSFPKLDMEVRPHKGRMVIFHNCHPGQNVRHPNSLHGGMPVLAGEKWACNLWFRERQFQLPTAVPGNTSTQSTAPKFSRVI